MGPYRVWHPEHDYPGLAMSRSLGDYIAHDFGVSEEPEITTYDLQSNDKFIVLGSDGVWEFLSNQTVIDLVAKNLPDGLRVAADELIEEAYNQWVSSNFQRFY